jgi:lipid-binding SYLF domain-containing protein
MLAPVGSDLFRGSLIGEKFNFGRSKEMKKIPVLLIVVFIFGISALAVTARAEDYSSTIKVFQHSPVLGKFFKNAYGYAVFPTVGKAGYVVGGSYGTGQVYRHNKVTGKSTMMEGSIGFQAGAEAFSEIIFFEDKQAYDKFTNGNFEFDATAQAVAITVGAEAQVGTAGASAGVSGSSKTDTQAKTNYINGMATFVLAKGGLVLEFSLGGQKFTFQHL